MSVSFLTENRTMQTIRARVAFHSRQHGFDKRMQQLLTSEGGFSSNDISELYAFWGDPLTHADEQFLRSALAEAKAAEGPILLAGASLLTLILGAICDGEPSEGKQVWCLESDRHWANLIRSWLTEYRVNGAHVIQSRPKLYDDFVWYAVDTGRLAKTYRLVICDGAKSSPKGVVGCVARLGERFDSRFTLLARNVKDAAVLRELNAWAKSHNAKFALIDKQEGFIKLSRNAEPSVADQNLPGVREISPPPQKQQAKKPVQKPRPPAQQAATTPQAAKTAAKPRQPARPRPAASAQQPAAPQKAARPQQAAAPQQAATSQQAAKQPSARPHQPAQPQRAPEPQSPQPQAASAPGPAAKKKAARQNA